ncbi:MAG: dUTP diphosphatase [bacterium]|nr:dUTP diphosphatase [bacterium]
MNPIHVQIKRVRTGFEDIPLPQPATPYSSGCDLRAAVETTIELPPMGRMLVPTSFAVAIPVGFEGQVRPRSGLALKAGISIPNTPGTVDSDYRGELQVIVINLSQETFTIHRGDRIAQLVITPVYSPQFVEVEELPESERGEGGFGHTGKH